MPILKDEALLGIVNEVSIFEAPLSGASNRSTPVSGLANQESFVRVSLYTSLGQLAEYFAHSQVAMVVEDGKILRVLTKIDLIAHLSS